MKSKVELGLRAATAMRLASAGLFLLIALVPQVAAAGDSAEGICATTSDPASCQQLISNAVSQGAASQLPGSSTGSGIQQLLQTFSQGQLPTAVPGTAPGPQPSVVVTPTQPTLQRQQERSHLEEIYSKRAGADLSQFGYDIIGNGGSVSALQIGAVQDQYILGQGDEIIVTLRGQENATYNIFVDRDGNVTLPRLRPISASGRRFGDFREDLNAAIREGYIQTQDYITVGQVRQISVNVAGEVFNPGVYGLSGLSTVLDSLELAGGVKKSGSLRDITVVRDGHSIHIDLYRFLSPEGRTPDTTLRQGDRVVVAPIGATVAVSGEVGRPGIYELDPGVHLATARWLIQKANGYSIRGTYRLTILRTRADGKLEYVDASGRVGEPVRDGEILIVNSAVDYSMGNVTLEGNVRLPGDYALNKVRTLHDLLPSAESFLPLTYTPFAFIVREDKITLQRKVIAFSVAQLLAGTYNSDLQSRDVVHILTLNAMQELLAASIAPQNAEGAPVLATPQIGAGTQVSAAPTIAAGTQMPPGAAPQANCIEEEARIRNLPKPEVAPALHALKLPSCPSPQANAPTPANNLAQILASATPGQSGMMNALSSSGSVAQVNPSLASGPSGLSPAAVSGSQIGGSIAAGTGGSSAVGLSASIAASSAPSAVEGLSSDEAAVLGLVVADYRVTLEGGVREPGTYLVAPGATLEEVVDAANGLVPDADLDAVEITSVNIDNVGGRSTTNRKLYSLTPEKLASITLQRLDVVQIPRVPSEQEEGNVLIDGELRFPGTYHILKGEKLSSVLARAGGLTKLAYPMGAVFQRPSVARLQQTAYGREADDLQKQLMASVAQGGSVLSAPNGQSLGLSPEAAGFIADVILQLRNKAADGRISIIADPVALAANPEADIELQPGDTLFVPKRPSEVMVTGEVLNPGNYRFSAKLTVADYIGLSGGYDRYADEGHIFVVNPDGTSRGVSDDLLDFTPEELAPGSVVVVPRDLKPLDLGALTVTVAKVFSDFAISAASVAVLSHNSN